MREEDQAGVSLAVKGKLGKVRFFRYSLTVNYRYQDQQEAILSEVFDWVKAAGVRELHSVSASYAKEKKVLVVTMAFADKVLANVFINMESRQGGFIKKSEIAGTKGLYVFSSENEAAFTSDCLLPAEYQFKAINPANIPWINKINTSLASGEVAKV